jgi:hypothetical protein
MKYAKGGQRLLYQPACLRHLCTLQEHDPEVGYVEKWQERPDNQIDERKQAIAVVPNWHERWHGYMASSTVHGLYYLTWCQSDASVLSYVFHHAVARAISIAIAIVD